MSAWDRKEAARVAAFPALMSEWYAYRKAVYGGHLPNHDQEDECRRSFLGGVAGGINLMHGLAEMAEPLAIKYLEDVKSELRLVPSHEFESLNQPPPQFPRKN